MNYKWTDEYVLSKAGAYKEYKIEWEAYRYMISDKMIGLLGNDNKGRKILTVKCEIAFGEFLRSQFEDIRPGYHMNKQHWNSLDLEGTVPDNIVKEMIDQSYDLVLKSMSKKKQAEILSEK